MLQRQGINNAPCGAAQQMFLHSSGQAMAYGVGSHPSSGMGVNYASCAGNGAGLVPCSALAPPALVASDRGLYTNITSAAEAHTSLLARPALLFDGSDTKSGCTSEQIVHKAAEPSSIEPPKLARLPHGGNVLVQGTRARVLHRTASGGDDGFFLTNGPEGQSHYLVSPIKGLAKSVDDIFQARFVC